MKEFIELIKKLWSNKRYRSLVILLMYFIFFIFVFMFINSTSDYVAPTGIDIIKNEINYKITVGEKVVSFNNNQIIYMDNIYNEMPLELQEYKLDILSPINIYTLLKNSTLESTNFTLNTDTYIIKLSEFERLLNNNELESDEIVKLIVYKDGYKKVSIDNYYGYSVLIEFGG